MNEHCCATHTRLLVLKDTRFETQHPAKTQPFRDWGAETHGLVTDYDRIKANRIFNCFLVVLYKFSFCFCEKPLDCGKCLPHSRIREIACLVSGCTRFVHQTLYFMARETSASTMYAKGHDVNRRRSVCFVYRSTR